MFHFVVLSLGLEYLETTPTPPCLSSQGWRSSLQTGIDTYDADTEKALVASIASAAGVDSSQVVIESVSFSVKVWISLHILSLLTFFLFFYPVLQQFATCFFFFWGGVVPSPV